MTTIKVTLDDEKIVIEREEKVTFEEVCDALRNTRKLIPLARPYPYLDSFIQIFGSKDMKFYKMVGRDIDFFLNGTTNKMVMLSFEPTKAEYIYIEESLIDDLKEILR